MSDPDILDLEHDGVVAFLGDLFERRGSQEYLGEAVTMAEHMLQAATLAERAGQSEELVVAALLHDIGHFTGELGSFTMEDSEDRLHEEAGAKFLERFFPSLVTDCVRQHVAAKRYLCATRPNYFRRLSEASVHSLSLQGGPMSADEVAAFETSPHSKEILLVRCYDDTAKRPDMETPSFTHFAPIVRRVIDRHRGGVTRGVRQA